MLEWALIWTLISTLSRNINKFLCFSDKLKAWAHVAPWHTFRCKKVANLGSHIF